MYSALPRLRPYNQIHVVCRYDTLTHKNNNETKKKTNQDKNKYPQSEYSSRYKKKMEGKTIEMDTTQLLHRMCGGYAQQRYHQYGLNAVSERGRNQQTSQQNITHKNTKSLFERVRKRYGKRKRKINRTIYLRR